MLSSRVPLGPRSMCLYCQIKRATLPHVTETLQPWSQLARSASTFARRKPASRMRLSPNVSKSALPDAKSKKPDRFQNGPWSATNQTRVRLRDNARPRSDAELKRAAKPGRFKEQAQEKEKDEDSWIKPLKMQIALTPVPYNRRMAIKEKIADITSFDQFPLLDVVREAVYKNALSGMEDITPTPIQRVAIPALLGHNNKIPATAPQDDHAPKYDQFLLAAETGSGKTLAYLVPVIDALKHGEAFQKEQDKIEADEKARKQAEEKALRERNNVFELESPELTTPDTHPDVAKPKVIILVPTSELVNQVGQLVKQLSHTVKFRSALINSSQTPRRIRNSLFNPAGLDVLISTPHLVSSIAESNPYILSRVTHIIADEADSLFDRSFAPITNSIIERAASSLKQLILCSATIPRHLDNRLRELYPNIRRLVTPNLHAIPRRVQLGVVDVDKEPYHGKKSLACADVIWSLGKAGSGDEADAFARITGSSEMRHIIVFVNERETADEVADFLSSKGIDAVSLTRDTPEKRQAEILNEFTQAKLQLSEDDKKLLMKSKKFDSEAVPFLRADEPKKPDTNSKSLANTKVLVITDLGSRGIDTVAVKTVILYDVPHSTIDFIHRLGRLGRMGRRGRGIVLVNKKDRKDVVKGVREAMFRGQALI
ncbi:ATP-dependent RNA helicase mrh4 [Arthroderma uncinatum]|uniref:ATP-dependent RNA helicase mrh4 n=1 Tax=Arthroderma uncinatum TaxID=74035 RepID=UPI00144AAA80|nr:ATP-dependent RNA helicase mrh4 [Arthroderma uncinatum]KAF3480455.1 ATP-dependent RNA helicase mrh4 [Arthroderma uncinatum]